MNFRVNYSLSKSIDDASRLSGNADAGVGGVQDVRNRVAERALSDFDCRHALSGSFIYRFQFKRQRLFRDWQINSLLSFFSGTPVSPQVANPDLSIGEANRPDRIGSRKLDHPTPGLWFTSRPFSGNPRGR